MEPYEYHPDMNERLREIREALGMTQEAIGKAIGISGSRYGNLEQENGEKIQEHTVICLCCVLSVNYDYLVYGKGEMFNKPGAWATELQQLCSQLKDTHKDYLMSVVKGLLDLQKKEHPEDDASGEQ